MSLQDNTLAYQMTIHRWGIKRQLKKGTFKYLLPNLSDQIESNILSATKRIIESPEYDKIVSRDGYATTWLQEHAVPSILKKGIYLIPTLFCNDVDEYVEDYKNDRENILLPQFLNAYESQVEIARLTLGIDLWDSLEYPTPEKMRALFSVETCYVTFDVPQSLKFVSDELFSREKKKIEVQWREAEEAINQLLIRECAELVEGLQRALTGLNDGTLKRFREANLENLREWSELFLVARNVTENAELERVVLSIKSALANVQREDLKHDRGSLRQYVSREMTGIQAELKSLMDHEQERQISFD